MVDRPTLTFRTLTVAALGVLLLLPEAIVHPSFQMSFAATLALVAGYQQGLPWLTARADTPLGARVALWGGGWIAGALIVSLLAGTATTPYIAYHFHRISSYGVLANLLAMPVVSVWVMPAGILGMLAMPFGFDALCWHLMGQGIEWMIVVALWVTSLPGAVVHMAAFGTGPLLAVQRRVGAAQPVQDAAAMIGALGDRRRRSLGGAHATPRCAGRRRRHRHGRPGRRRPAGDRTIWPRHIRGARMACGRWRMSAAPKDKALGEAFRCDAAGCIGRLRDGALVALVRGVEAFEEDCRRAAVVVSAREAPPDCAALVVDRRAYGGERGALALRRVGERFEIDRGPARGLRPALGAGATAAQAARLGRLRPDRARPRDATPNAQDLEPGERQYRRNSPTSLPWIRTRFGGRMRTS